MRLCIAPLLLLALVLSPFRIAAAEESTAVVPVSLLCPACGAWIIDRPMLASAEGAIDAFVLSTIVMAQTNARGSAEEDSWAGAASLAGFGLLVLNRAWAVPVNAWLASKPRGEPEWTSRSRHRLEGGLELVQAQDNNGWIGLRGGIGDFRIGLGWALAEAGRELFADSGNATRRIFRSMYQGSIQADWGWAADPHMRLFPGLKAALARSTEFVRTDGGNPGDVPGPDRTGVALVPLVSMEITQWDWLAVTAHLGISAWSSGAPMEKAGTWDAGFGLSARAFPF